MYTDKQRIQKHIKNLIINGNKKAILYQKCTSPGSTSTTMIVKRSLLENIIIVVPADISGLYFFTSPQERPQGVYDKEQS